MYAQHELGNQPGGRAQHEERGLQVVHAVVDELGLFHQGQVRRTEDGEEPLVDVVAVTLCPAHPLAGQTPEGGDAFRRGLRVWRVDDLKTLGVEPEGQLPVFGQAATPAEFLQESGADHVGRARDHLHGAEHLLVGTFHHVAAGILRAHRSGEPALALVQDMPLVALYRADLGKGARSLVSVAVEVIKEIVEHVRKRHGVSIEDGDELGARIHGPQRMRQRATLVSIPGIPVNDLEAIDVVPGLEDLHGSVRRVIDENDLVAGIVQPGAGFE